MYPRKLTALLFFALAGTLPASRLAGIAQIQSGAVAAFSGQGENEQIRRSLYSLRLDFGDRVRTSAGTEGWFVAKNETRAPLSGETEYQARRDGFWRLDSEGGQVRLLDLRPGSGLQVRLVNDGAGRVQAQEDETPRLFEDGLMAVANTRLLAGSADRLFFWGSDGSRGVFFGPGTLRVETRGVFLEEGTLYLWAGSRALELSHPRGQVTLEEGALKMQAKGSSPQVLLAQGRGRAEAFGHRRRMALKPLEPLRFDPEAGIEAMPRSNPELASEFAKVDGLVRLYQNGVDAALEAKEARRKAAESRPPPRPAPQARDLPPLAARPRPMAPRRPSPSEMPPQVAELPQIPEVVARQREAARAEAETVSLTLADLRGMDAPKAPAPPAKGPEPKTEVLRERLEEQGVGRFGESSEWDPPAPARKPAPKQGHPLKEAFTLSGDSGSIWDSKFEL